MHKLENFFNKACDKITEPFKQIERETQERQKEVQYILTAAKVAGVASACLGTVVILSALGSGNILLALAGLAAGGQLVHDGIRVFKNASNLKDLPNDPAGALVISLIPQEWVYRIINEGLLDKTFFKAETRFISRQVKKLFA